MFVRVVVAGNTGLVGSSICKTLSSAGFEVFGINRSVLDLGDFDAALSFLFEIQPKIVIDAAAKVGGIQANNAFPVEFLTENISIQCNLMKAAHAARVDKFVFLGSSCIYPRNCPQPMREDSLLTGKLEESNSAYAMAKLVGIELINAYRKEFGHHWISLIPANVYGPRDNFSLSDSHVIPAMIRKFDDATRRGIGVVDFWGSGEALREFLYVDDLAQAVMLSLEICDSETLINIGSSEEVSIRNLAETIAGLMDFSGDLRWDKTKLEGTPRKVLESSRIRSLGWSPRVSLKDGLRKTIDWYKKASQLNEVRI